MPRLGQPWRRAIAVAFAAGLVVGLGSRGLAADDEAAAALQRVEVPEASVAVTFPSGWAVDIEMRERQDWGLHDEGLAEDPVTFWNLVYASASGRPWCELVWYPTHPLALAEHAERYRALMTPTLADVERTIEVQPQSLPAGDAHRFVIHNEPTDDYTTTYLLGMGDSHFLLRCVADDRSEDDWLAVADSLEPIGWMDETTEEQ